MNFLRNEIHGISGYKRMKETGLLSNEEISFIDNNKKNIRRIGTTLYYSSIAGSNADDPLRMQFVPSIKELETLSCENNDPLCEARFSPYSRIIHRYHDRVLFIASHRCALYCRHCFRRYLDEETSGDADAADVENLYRYVSSCRQIKEVIISGGDPLLLDNDFLSRICGRIRDAGSDIVIRIGTRVPAVLPSRIDGALTGMLSKYKPLFIFTQFNHHREVSVEASAAVDCFIRAGIPVFNQTVLLKGINNSEEELEKLFYALTAVSVKPYYLFQGDLACGTSHLRTNLLEGIGIMENLRKRMSALSLPLLAVDLPGGGGKALLSRESVIKNENGFFYIRSNEGKIFTYPDENRN
jgi:lysine 2,3-aminomutase